MVRKLKWRRDRTGRVSKKEVNCFLGSSCVWPECTCPVRERSTECEEQAPVMRGRVVYRRPVGPVLPRKRRPKGWSPLSDWCLVRTKGRQENWAAQNCRQQDMETFLPRYMEPGSGIVTLPRQRKPEKGEAVEIKIGAWQGFTGLYDGLNDQGRIRVLLSFMGRQVALEFKRFQSIQVVNA
jgi:hypothetical protein